jgi:hypothetical protein
MLTLGGIDTRADLTPMVYARNVASTGWFTVFVKNIYVREQGGQSVTPDGPHQKLQRVNANLFEMNSGKGVIVDSGTTDTYLHRSVAGPFNEVWEKVTGRKYSNSVSFTYDSSLYFFVKLICAFLISSLSLLHCRKKTSFFYQPS